MPQVTITITPDGNATVEVNGVQGPQCQDLTVNVQRVLGTVESVQHKDEFDQLGGESAQTGMDQF